MARIEFSRLRKTFGAQPAVADFSLVCEEGRVTVILGPSGCGKTTVLRMAAGLEAPDAGIIRFDDRVVNDPRPVVPAERRGVGMVFQSLALWPHWTVGGNLRFASRGRAGADDARRLLEMVGLADRERAFPHELSGGERQRVALARALVGRPQVLLLDEPLSDLDPALRVELAAAMHDVQRRTGVTTLFVTHAQDEAFTLADKLVVMRAGRVAQEGTPAEVYERPRTRFVAGFVGTAAVLPGALLRTEEWRPFGAAAAPGVAEERDVALRPESIEEASGGLTFRVAATRFLGAHHLLSAARGEARVHVLSDVPRPVGAEIVLRLRAGARLSPLEEEA
ncbi:MAG: ABC transporter ATP-binding protein [Planctomycetes bacterium]|nr:ABC transporter ATP-binding protein [Planctomycetota bacterium]